MQQPDVPAQGNHFRRTLSLIWGACKHRQLGCTSQMDIVAALLTTYCNMGLYISLCPVVKMVMFVHLCIMYSVQVESLC